MKSSGLVENNCCHWLFACAVAVAELPLQARHGVLGGLRLVSVLPGDELLVPRQVAERIEVWVAAEVDEVRPPVLGGPLEVRDRQVRLPLEGEQAGVVVEVRSMRRVEGERLEEDGLGLFELALLHQLDRHAGERLDRLVDVGPSDGGRRGGPGRGARRRAGVGRRPDQSSNEDKQ
jgi:hypothetical protein